MNKELKFGKDAKKAIRAGIDVLADAVGSTLGPNGNLVVIGKYSVGKPHVTKDGVTVAKNISFSNEYMDAGANLIREASLKQLEVGDGTTSSTIIAQSLIHYIDEALEQNKTTSEISRDIDACLNKTLHKLSELSTPIQSIEDLRKVATISANNDIEIGNLIADAFEKISKDGVITVDESSNINTTIEVISGMQFDRGYVSPYFCTDTIKNQCVLEKPYILITDEKINRLKDIIPLIEIIYKEGRSLLLIAEDFDSEVINNLAINLTQGLKICCIKCPSFGEYRVPVLEDLAYLTGGQIATYENTIEPKDITLEMLGEAEKVIISKNDTTIINGFGLDEDIQTRVQQLKEQLKHIQEDPQHAEFLDNYYRTRIARLAGGIAVIHVGGTTELELKERKDRIDDAIAATKAAIEEGIVPGGGITYYHCGTNNTILGKALCEPLFRIANSCNISSEEILVQINSHNSELFGFDAKRNCYVDNMCESGIIDPTKTVKMAILNAVSVAKLYLMTNCVIVPENID